MREVLTTLLETYPFRPFEIVLTCGRSYVVGRPENVAVKDEIVHLLDPEFDARIFCRFDCIELIEVATRPSIEGLHADHDAAIL